MKLKTLLITFACGLLFFSAGCTPDNTLQKKYGADASYFMGLRAAQLGDEVSAIRDFKRSIKKGSSLIARKSREALTTMGSNDARIKECFLLHQTYHDEDSLLLLCKALYDNREYAQVIKVSEEIDLTECSNELAYYRCSSLLIKNDKSFNQEYIKWCTSRPFSREQYQLFCEVDKNPSIIALRSLAYIRNYGAAYEKMMPFLDNESYLTPVLLSDFGKILLNGSALYEDNIKLLENLASKVDDAERLYFIHFYEARLFDKFKNHTNDALDFFMQAMQEATSHEQYDNALWYMLNTSLKLPAAKTIELIEKYKDTWHDSYYFDDFFDKFSVKLLSEHSWKEYYRTAKIIRGKASPETSAKFSYVTARLVEEGLLQINSLAPEELVSEMLSAALNSGTNIYYRMLAANALSVPQDKVLDSMKILCKDDSFEVDEQEERLLLGYAEFGFPEKIYTEWSKNSRRISMECSEKLAMFLKNCGSSSPEYYHQSLRIASRKFNKSEKDISSEILKMSFPMAFTESVAKYCKEFSMDEPLIYALIRSESYFSPAARSSAGATGLTQLMDMTAGDIARKLKKTSYDLTDSNTNIQFGTFYMEEMIRRLDGSKIQGIFAYNAGISSVRSWLKNAQKEFGKSIPNDLLLESIPYTETREYGRKVLAASIMYGLLYYDISYSQMIQDILQLSQQNANIALHKY